MMTANSVSNTVRYRLNVSDLPLVALNLAKFFTECDPQMYLVGGFVRDLLLGRQTHDIDIVVSSSMQETGSVLAKALNGKFVVLDHERGIGRVVVTQRDDVQHIDFMSLNDHIESNLSRRDFTIDAMAIRIAPNLTQLEIIDPFDGQSDLVAGYIRALNDHVFQDDPCRLLRGPRLAAQLNMQIEGRTQQAIRTNVGLVNKVAGERIRDEFLKLLATAKPTPALRLLDELGLLCEIMPEFLDAKGVDQPPEHYWDVFGHLIESPSQVERVLSVVDVEQDEAGISVPTFNGMQRYFAEHAGDGFSRRTLLKFAALLHDVGKPGTKTVDATGRIRFLGHQQVGAETAERISKRLRLSGKGRELLSGMVMHHLRPSQLAQAGEMPTPRAIYRYFRDLGEVAMDTVYLNMADYLAAKGPELEIENWIQHCRVMERIIESKDGGSSQENTPRLLYGHILMERFDLTAGPLVGELLELVREAQVTGEIHTTDEALELVKVQIKGWNAGA